MNSINDFKGKTFKQAEELCETNKIHLMLSDDENLHELGKLVYENGVTAGACYVAAILYVNEHGPEAAISEGVDLLKKAATNMKRDDILKEIHEHEYWIAYGVKSKSTPFMQMKKMPMVVPKRLWSRHAGFMNLILNEGAKRMSAESTTGMLAAMGVNNLLDYMMTGKHNGRDKYKGRKK